MIDFERASTTLISKSFPVSNLSGDSFHLCENVYRSVTRLDLKTLYSENKNFPQQIRSLPVLGFLAASDVIPSFDEITDQFSVEGEPLLKYFEESYIGVKSRLSRSCKSPKCDISL